MIRIVADDKIPFLKGALEEVAAVRYLPGHAIVTEDLKNVQVLVTRTRTLCNRELLENTPVEFIASATIGVDHIDADYCREAGIRWTNAPGCNSASVQQYVVAALLHISGIMKESLPEKTLGIIGVGNVGSKVAVAARALGMPVLLNDPPRERIERGKDSDPGFVSLDELLLRSDVVTIHTPLNRGGEDNTYELVNEGFLSRMKRGAVLINTSRGEVVDEQALLGSLNRERIAHAVLDVFRNEPAINRELMGALTLATPHIAGYSVDGKANGTTQTVRAISRHFQMGYEEWAPGSLPEPEVKELQADCSGVEPLEAIREIYLQTYDITRDDDALRKKPEGFERLRGDYPVRREPGIYTVRLFQGYEEVTIALEALGFNVLSDHCF